jgi:type I restriction enzyme S subunit
MRNYNFGVVADIETAEHVGAVGTFQIVKVENGNGDDFTRLVDQGNHYSSLEQVHLDLAHALGAPLHGVQIEEV